MCEAGATLPHYFILYMPTANIYTIARAAHLARARAALLALVQSPPQVLLLEAGTEAERQSVARWWAAALHCAAVQKPCLVCASCMQIADQVHLDTLAYDGRISNKDDEENPGSVRALTIDNARTLKSTLGTPPHSGQRRTVILCGLEGERREAANALLKVLEEPQQSAVFILLTPMRTQILPTLVSRSFVLTLPWPGADRMAQTTDADAHAHAESFAQGLVNIIENGRGWWHLTSGKGAVDSPLAESVLLACRRALTVGLRAANTPQGDALTTRFAALAPAQALAAGRLLDEAEEALRYNVTPARVLDLLAVRLHGVFSTSDSLNAHNSQSVASKACSV